MLLGSVPRAMEPAAACGNICQPSVPGHCTLDAVPIQCRAPAPLIDLPPAHPKKYPNSDPPPRRYAIAIHGGAGVINSRDKAQHAAAKEGLRRSLRAGQEVLQGGGSALDAVQAAVVAMEDDPSFNAGEPRRGVAARRSLAASLQAQWGPASCAGVDVYIHEWPGTHDHGRGRAAAGVGHMVLFCCQFPGTPPPDCSHKVLTGGQF
jgi:hypothetical protein